MEPVASRSDTSVSTVEATRRLAVPRPPEVKPLGMDGQQLRARLMTRAPALSNNFNTITLGLNRVTKTQRLAIKRREPTRLEPLVSENLFSSILIGLSFLLFFSTAHFDEIPGAAITKLYPE